MGNSSQLLKDPYNFLFQFLKDLNRDYVID